MTTNRTPNGNTELAVPSPSTSPDPERHSRKCKICHHPDREAIEEAFINWHYPDWLSRIFGLNAGSMAVYRHAHAFGLFEVRRRNLRSAVERLIEKATATHPSAGDVLHAISMHARVSAEGELRDAPPQRFIVERRLEPPPSPAALPPAQDNARVLEGTVESTGDASEPGNAELLIDSQK